MTFDRWWEDEGFLLAEDILFEMGGGVSETMEKLAQAAWDAASTLDEDLHGEGAK